jgi:hypothetical protein
MKLEYSVSVRCSSEKLWQTFTEVGSWPAWSNLVKEASWIEGAPWVAGSKFLIEITAPSFKLKAEATEVAAPHTFAWKGTVMGVAVEHHFDFATQPDGSTLAKSWIDLSGPAVFFITAEMKKKGLAMFGEFMAGLKQQAEAH